MSKIVIIFRNLGTNVPVLVSCILYRDLSAALSLLEFRFVIRTLEDTLMSTTISSARWSKNFHWRKGPIITIHLHCRFRNSVSVCQNLQVLIAAWTKKLYYLFLCFLCRNDWLLLVWIFSAKILQNSLNEFNIVLG